MTIGRFPKSKLSLPKPNIARFRQIAKVQMRDRVRARQAHVSRLQYIEERGAYSAGQAQTLSIVDELLQLEV